MPVNHSQSGRVQVKQDDESGTGTMHLATRLGRANRGNGSCGAHGDGPIIKVQAGKCQAAGRT